jgi:bifunctional enzyme CysN/CysC
VTLTLQDEIDASRGDVIAMASHPLESADQFEANLLWLSDHPMLSGRPYGALIHTKSATVTITQIKHLLDVNSGSFLAAKTVGLNEITTVNLSFDRLVPFASYSENRRMGAFILIDKVSNETVGAGMIHFALRRSLNVHWHALEVTKTARPEMKHQVAQCLMVHWPFRVRQVNHRQPIGKTSACGRQAHFYLGRGQCAPRAQSRFGLQRS